MTSEENTIQLSPAICEYVNSNRLLIEILLLDFTISRFSKTFTYEEIAERLEKKGKNTMDLFKELNQGIQLGVIDCYGNDLVEKRYFLNKPYIYKRFIEKQKVEAKEK